MSPRNNKKEVNQCLDSPRQKKWLCVQCKTQQESKAKANLKQQGFAVYLPTVPSKTKKQSKLKTDIRAMFPGYLFIETELEYQDLSVIRSTVGCISLLRNGSQPSIVPDHVMASIKEAEGVLHGRFGITQGFTTGTKYSVMKQGFDGHTATFLSLDSNDRARVLVTLFGSEREIGIPTSSLGLDLA